MAAAIVSAVTALTPVAGAHPEDSGCGAHIDYIAVGGTPVLQFAGSADTSKCLPPMQL